MEHHLTPDLLETIDQYIKGTLAGPKLLSFEDALKKNDSLRAEVDLQRQLFNALDEHTTEWQTGKDDDQNKLQQALKQKLKSPEYQSLSRKIKHIGQDYIQEQARVKQPLWKSYGWLLAAILAFLMIAGIWYALSKTKSPDNYYRAYADWNTELPSFVEKSAAKNTFAKGESLFKNKEYEQAISLFQTLEREDELYPYGLMYMGAAYDQLDDDQKALEVFQTVAELDAFPEKSRGLWYEMLIYLKQNDTQNAVETLRLILKSENNYKYQEAAALLQQLSGEE